MSSYARANVRITNEKKNQANFHEGITWSEVGKQNVQAKGLLYIAALLFVSLEIGHKPPIHSHLIE